jgi:hypothetical protein
MFGICGATAGAYGFGLGAAVLLVAALIGGLWVVGDALWERHNTEILYREGLVRARTQFTQAIAAADPETRYFLAHEWPELGVEFGEEKILYVLKNGVNTQVLVSFLRAFLEDSTENGFVELRNYNDDKRLQTRFGVPREKVRVQWQACTEFLEREGYLRPGSMAGNQTWKWTSREHYNKLMRRYGNVRGLEQL